MNCSATSTLTYFLFLDHCDSHQAWRRSFSIEEKNAIKALPTVMKNALQLIKNDLETMKKESSGQSQYGQSRPTVTSYHLKTVCLHESRVLNRSDVKTITLKSVYDRLIGRFLTALVDKSLPNYFMPKANLLEKLGDVERWYLRWKFQALLDDPIKPSTSTQYKIGAGKRERFNPYSQSGRRWGQLAQFR